MKQYLFILSIMSLALLGCNKEKFDSLPHGYYTLDYRNWAWGYKHNGWMMDAEGNVLSFDLPAKWNDPDSLGYISEAALLENLSYCGKKVAKETKRKIYQNNQLIEGAAKGNVSLQDGGARDMGTSTYICYRYDAARKLYKKITLKMEGDIEAVNESDDAAKIVKWMKKL